MKRKKLYENKEIDDSPIYKHSHANYPGKSCYKRLTYCIFYITSYLINNSSNYFNAIILLKC